MRPRIVERLLSASLSTRLAVLLIVGVAGGASLALAVSESARLSDAVRTRDAQVAVRVSAIAAELRANPKAFNARLRDGHVFGVRAAPYAWPSRIDGRPRRALAAVFGVNAPAASLMPPPLCLPFAAARADRVEPCWYVRLPGAAGADRVLAVDLPLAHVFGGPLVDPIYLALLVGLGGLIAVVAAYVAGAPLARLTAAAGAFARSLDAEPIPVEGPREIRTALQTFNKMQSRMREAMRERTHMLAAVTHDLQTPLTRMRLRLDQVSNPELRERLLDDLGAMQRLVREGLELAESRESREPWSTLDLDSLLSSLAEDAAEAGHAARFVGGVGMKVRTKPDALRRCVQNLLDNAVSHGGDAELSSRRAGRVVEVLVRDHGLGVPEAHLEAVFEPFRQLAPAQSRARGGTGLGLAIARAKAELLGGELRLANHPGGGLVATIRLHTL